MKRILMTTAIVAALGSGTAFADSAQPAATTVQTNAATAVSASTEASAPGMVFAKDVSAASVKGDIMASTLIGKNVYIPKPDASAKAGDETANLDEVGSVGDVILTGDGKVDAVLVDVGGFLGIGTHTVALDWSGLHWRTKPDAKSAKDSYIVVNATKAQLENAPAFKTSWLERTVDASRDMAKGAAATASQAAGSARQAMADAAGKTKAAVSNAAESAKQAMSGASDTASGSAPDGAKPQTGEMHAEASGAAKAPAAMPESGSAGANATADAAAPGSALAKAQADGYTEAKAGAVASASLKGAKVYDARGDDIGEVSKLVVDPSSNQVKGAVIEVGGFLGLGEKPVMLPMDQVHVMTKENGKDVRLYVGKTEKQLKAMPSYKSKG